MKNLLTLTAHSLPYLDANIEDLRGFLCVSMAERVAAGNLFIENLSCSHANRSSLRRTFLCTRCSWTGGTASAADYKQQIHSSRNSTGKGSSFTQTLPASMHRATPHVPT